MGTTKKKDTTATAATKGKFNGMIHRSGDDVLKGRGDRIIKSAKLAQEDLVRTLEQRLLQLEDKQDQMLDISTDNRFSLKIGDNFDAKPWVDEYQKVSIDIVNTKVEFEIAKRSLAELFD